MNFSRFFIDRPIFAGVLSILIFLAGLLALPALPISEYPEVVPPSVVVRAQLSRRQPQGDRRDGGDAARGADQRRREHALHEQPGHHRRRDDADRHLQARHRSGQGHSSWCRTGSRRPSRACPSEVRQLGVTTIKSSPDLTMVVHLLSPNGRYDMTYLRNYAVLQRQGPAGAHRRRRPGAAVRRRRLFDARLARSAEGRRARPVGRATSCARSASRTSRWRPASSAPRRASPGIDLQLSVNAQGRLQTEEEFGDIIVKTGANGEVTRLRDVARIELGAADYALRSLLDNKSAVAIADLPGAGLQRHRDLRRRPQDDGRAEEEHARGRRLPASSTTPPSSCAPRSRRWCTRCSKPSRWSCWS